ncbi:MAG: hypothetical protein K2G64_00765, partial [Muribaculaceae bacterium]|nr:hypothetical protein [Muribaculaceae bacterium]
MFSPLSLKKHILFAVFAAALMSSCGGTDNAAPAEQQSASEIATDSVAADDLKPQKVKVKFST